MSVKFHESFCLDSQQDQLLWWDDFLGDQLQDEWRSTGSVGGSAVVVDQQTGGIVRITTNNVDNENWRIDWSDIRTLLVDKRLAAEIRAKLSTTSSINAYFYLIFDFSNYIRFWFDTDAAHTNWQITCTNGGATTGADTGIAVDASYHIFRIECFPTGQVHFYIDGVETANSPITTNIPDDAGDYLQPYILLRTRENVAKSMDVDYIVVRQEI